jgi:hypothetical protein
MNACKRIEVLLALRPTDRSIKEQKQVQAHLSVCPDCAALDRAYDEQRRLIGSAPLVRLTPSQRGRLQSRIQHKRKRYKMSNKLSAILGTTAAIAALLAVWVYVEVLHPSGMPAAPQVTFTMSTPTSTASFELGGHVRDQNLPFANRMRYAGMTWTKVQVHYGQYPSSAVAASHDNGFKIQLTALGTPRMVTQPDFEQDFADWTSQMAAAGADAIEIWNEPNIEREWQAGHISPEAYTNLLCAAYQAIKAANPDTLVISAAPTPINDFGGCTVDGCDDQPWMEELYKAGAADCLDYIGAHHTAGATSPSAEIGHPADLDDAHHSWFFLPQTELYYDIFQGTRQIFYTEMGYASQEGVPPFPDAFAWASGTTDSEQAQWLAEAVQLSIDTGMVRCIIIWNVDFARYGDDPQDGYAILRPDGSCPACDALHEVLASPSDG